MFSSYGTALVLAAVRNGLLNFIGYKCVYHSVIRFSVNLKNEIEITKAEFRFSFFVFHFDKIQIKNPILAFHYSIDEQLTEVGKQIRYLFSMCSQNKMGSSEAAGGGGTFIVY